jgi:glutamine synthetase
VNERLPLENPVQVLLDKDPADFTRADLLGLIPKLGIERLTFHYTGLDGQLKELKLPIASIAHAERVLAAGERLDGSSIFPGLLESSLSDLYVVPAYRTAFLNPFSEGSLDFVCRFLTRDGELAPFAPDNILANAYRRFQERTGMELHALTEVEFFLLGEGGPKLYTPSKQRGYHAAGPFFKYGKAMDEIVGHVSQITGAVKYAHAEVGFVESVRSDREMLKGRWGEQYEVEFNTRPIDEMGDFSVLTKWIVRNVAYRHGLLATFIPKLEEGIAGNGFHVHVELLKDGRNVMGDHAGGLSDDARKLVGGLVRYSPSLSAFGNTVSSAFLRLVPDQEAPTRICWSHSNRNALIRVPIAWGASTDMARHVNPKEPEPFVDERGRQTVELRSADGSALPHLLMAGMTTAAEWGLTQEGSLELAEGTRVEGNIFHDPELRARLAHLPRSCVESARLLEEQRDLYDGYGVFPPRVIDRVVSLLDSEDDLHLNTQLARMPADERLTATRKVMHQALHRG